MAEFCNQCATHLGFPTGDLKGITQQEDFDKELACIVICEGCGTILVDPQGNCISKDCLRGGHNG